jgi:hypothetical protein
MDAIGRRLQDYYPDTPIRLATQPGWPFEYTLGRVALIPNDAEGDGTEPTGDPVVWIAEGCQVSYLPPIDRHALGWSR